jgi:hypothetical protein
MFVLANVHNSVQKVVNQENCNIFTYVLGTPKVWVCCAQRLTACCSSGSWKTVAPLTSIR